ncbi:C40 family peptidase [Streptomyces sp. NEAU-W12]|uniref:C40 family peptidase n=1 Tax=Streptomyces sp. NEAU-W12 TaxID=2994668 RepID=UPI00224ADD1B|nr:C40 family peptidase [Streptomyces sp. NEAU-W12]MCX2924291.1 NlpC/P60 family protein [Streptomyces sp. NEAU-W12]
MSGMLLRLVCTAAVATGTVLAPASATAAADPPVSTATGAPEADVPTGGAQPGNRSVAGLLTDLQRLYREVGKATEAYNATEERLAKQRAETRRLDRALAAARLSLHDSRSAAGRLARQQYQSSTGISPYVRLLLARDPQHALDQGHVIGRLARNRAAAVGRLTGSEQRADALARQARKALDDRLALTERRGKQRAAVRERLGEVEELLASLTPGRLAALAELERTEASRKQAEFMASGALDVPGAPGAPGGPGTGRTPSAAGDRALRYAVEQIGKPYEWGAEGPEAFDCSGLTSEAWGAAGTPVPRTSQGQWARLDRVPLDELRPGDLVVYFPEATHVALYLGDGMVVQAPRPGARVKVSPIAANPVLGAVRPDPDGEPLRHHVPPELPAGATEGPDEGYDPDQDQDRVRGQGQNRGQDLPYAPTAPETSAR